MDYANRIEAVKALWDVEDMVMVKPGIAYLEHHEKR
jgi:delta-aminolevulinic acid dehydratase/porphobilinogen synthase